jgi:hypothetical protein
MGARVYLDTNHWIALARVRTGKSARHAGALGALENGITAGALNVVLTHANIGEVLHTGREKWRRDLADVMIGLSRGMYLRPRHIAVKLEVRDFIRRLRGLPAGDRFAEMVGLGTAAGLGATARLVGPDGERSPMEPTILKALDTLELQRWLITEAHDDAKTEDVHNKLQAAVDEMNARRREFRRAAPSLNVLRRDNAADLVRHTLVREVTEAMKDAGFLDPDLLLRFAPRQPEEGIMEFPSLHCVAELIARRDHDWDREIKMNDLADVDALSVAVPYANVDVCETYFGRKVVEAGLASRYGTHVHTSLDGFLGELAAGSLV